jgi:hypothetical protein
MRYLTYDLATRALTGAFLQDLREEHADCYIEVNEATYDNWHAYQLNEAGDGVEPIEPTVPVIDLGALKTALILKIDADVDAIYAAVIGNRSDEYNAARDEATAFAAAGYHGDVPASVQSWADAKGWYPQQAADDILAAAARLVALREMIRAQRLTKKEEARLAPDGAALDTVSGQWAAALATIRSAAGL